MRYNQVNLSEDLPSLILLDYNMPKGNGPEVLAILNRQYRFSNIPKIIWSTSGSENFVTECISKGAKAFFVKPDNFYELRELISQLMAFAD
jgi:CheY-like chemotaxis protein